MLPTCTAHWQDVRTVRFKDLCADVVLSVDGDDDLLFRNHNNAVNSLVVEYGPLAKHSRELANCINVDSLQGISSHR